MSQKAYNKIAKGLQEALELAQAFHAAFPLTYYCDNKRHLVCKPYSLENLHTMALDLGINRSWFDKDHYDIPKKRVDEIRSKCIVVSSKEIVKIIGAPRQKVRITPSHQTYIPLANDIKNAFRKSKNITAISSGVISTIRPANRRVKVMQETGCMLLKVRDVSAIQEIRLYTKDYEATKKELEAIISKLKYEVKINDT